ncbi:MAG: hypothetical protein QW474_03935 [Candidatus Aenigmatarchaeota archaeon]
MFIGSTYNGQEQKLFLNGDLSFSQVVQINLATSTHPIRIGSSTGNSYFF